MRLQPSLRSTKGPRGVAAAHNKAPLPRVRCSAFTEPKEVSTKKLSFAAESLPRYCAAMEGACKPTSAHPKGVLNA